MLDLCMLACGPAEMMAASLVMSAAGTAMTFAGQKAQAKKQEAYQNHLADLQLQAAHRKASALTASNIQQQEATARQRFQVSQEGAKAASLGRLSSIEGGVSGLSIDYLMDEYESQEGAYIHALTQEQGLRDRETQRSIKDTYLGAHQQRVSTMAPVNQPNAIASALTWGAQAAKLGYDYYGGGEAVKDKDPLGYTVPKGGAAIPQLPS